MWFASTLNDHQGFLAWVRVPHDAPSLCHGSSLGGQRIVYPIKAGSIPVRGASQTAYAKYAQCLLVSMGVIETIANTKTTLSTMSRWVPTRERLPGLHNTGSCIGNSSRGNVMTNDEQSRSSRGKKSVVGGKSC